MSNISFGIKKSLSSLEIEYNDFGDLLLYLLSKSVICEADSEIEKSMYRRYLMCEELVKDYFDVLGIGVFHNEVFNSVRIYAPDADYPMNINIADQTNNKLRMSLSKDENAALIVSYLLYQNYSQEDKLEEFTAIVSREEFYAAHATYLSYEPKENESARKDVLTRLAKLKVIEFNSKFFDQSDYPLIIRPYILDLILSENVKQYIKNEEMNSNEN